MKKNYEKYQRTSKSSRQAILQHVLDEALEELRKKCFPWQHRPFLYHDVVIEEHIFNDLQTMGQYETIQEENDYHYSHKILIIQRYIKAAQKANYYYLRKHHTKTIKRTIFHELLHAFCRERYEGVFYNITDKNRDASPIFLMLSEYLNIPTGHRCGEQFKHSELYNKKYKNFVELDDAIFELLHKYNDAVIPLLEESNREQFTKGQAKDLFIISREFTFSPREAGLEKVSNLSTTNYMKHDFDNKLHRIHYQKESYYVGCNIMPNDITRLVTRKATGQGKWYSNKKSYIIEDMKTINVKENSNIN